MQALAFYLFSAVTVISAIMVVTARNPVHSVFFLILTFFSAAGLFVLLEAEFLAMILIVVYVGAVAVLFLFAVMMLNIPVSNPKAWFIPHAKNLLGVSLRLLAFIFVFSLSTLCAYIIFDVTNYYVVDILTLLQQNEIFTMAGLAIYTAMAFMLSRQLAMSVTQTTFSRALLGFSHKLPVGWIIIAALFAELLVVVNMYGTHTMSQALSTAPTPPAMVMSNTQALGNLIYTDYIYSFQICGLILLLAMVGAIVLTLRQREGVKRQSITRQVNRTKEESVELIKIKPGQGVKI